MSPTPDLRVQLQSAVGDAYTLERELGQGGMATVYLARDLKHDRQVAFKVLRPEVATTLGPERFRREITLAARLQQPHILSVFDSGEAAGFLWYTMPYVDGESLRGRITRERQLAIAETLRIAREAASALDYAHRQGIIHRDIKPENILLTRDGDVLVADFGIARAMAEGSERLTETGLAVGTPAYMSPEQAAGDRQLDARSDQYSLACVLYEMLAGEPPFTGPTAQAIITRRFNEISRPLDAVRETVPPSVARAVARGLARVPADRFATVADFVHALDSPAATIAATQVSITARDPRWTGRRVALLALGAFALGLGVLFAWRRPNRPAVADSSDTGPVKIAVIPFDNLGDSADAYFADGITDAVRGKLAGLPRLEVTASTSSNRYRRSSKTPQEIGQELGVQYLLVGRIRYARQQGATSRVQVSPELIRTGSGSTTWQQPFDAALTDVFQVQTDIAGRVAGALGLALGASERTTLSERPTEDLAAYDAYLRGLQYMPELDADGVRRALPEFETAIARDSGFALAWARLSEVRNKGYTLGMGGGLDTLAQVAADRATHLAPDRPDGYIAAGSIAAYALQDAPRALTLFRKALALAPSDASVLNDLGSLEGMFPQKDSALGHLNRARELDPQNIAIAQSLADVLLYFKRLDEADRETDRGLAIQPGSRSLLNEKAQIALARGDLRSARTILQQLGSGPESGAALALCWDIPWALDSAQQETYLRLPAAPFGGNPVWQGNSFAILHRIRGDSAGMRFWADSALRNMEDWRKATPKMPFMHAVRGMLLGMLGRRAEAHAEAQDAMRYLTKEQSANNRAYIAHLAAWTEVLAGQYDAAIALLGEVLKAPYKITPAYLSIDPTFAPLKGKPGFEHLLESGS